LKWSTKYSFSAWIWTSHTPSHFKRSHKFWI